jgi:hypothetical protein
MDLDLDLPTLFPSGGGLLRVAFGLGFGEDDFDLGLPTLFPRRGGLLRVALGFAFAIGALPPVFF